MSIRSTAAACYSEHQRHVEQQAERIREELMAGRAANLREALKRFDLAPSDDYIVWDQDDFPSYSQEGICFTYVAVNGGVLPAITTLCPVCGEIINHQAHTKDWPTLGRLLSYKHHHDEQ